MKTISQLILILHILLLISCDNNKQVFIESSLVSSDTLKYVDIFQSKIFDTIQFDTLIFPRDDEFIANILYVSTFHEDEVLENAENKNWFGLFTKNGKYYLRETKVHVSTVFDPIVDEDSTLNKTGKEVSINSPDTSLLLMGGLNFLKNRNIIAYSLGKEYIYPGDSIKFNFLGKEYLLFATGGKIRIDNDPNNFYVWNYKLYLSALKNGIKITDLIVSTPQFDDVLMIEILFMGDIDGDGFLDFIIDTSADYNSTIPTLYLSIPADTNHLLKAVGSHISVGC